MTNQNVMVPETIAITMATAANHTVLLPYPPPKDVGDGFSILRKCLPLPGNGGRINVLLESMKALSPTHPIVGAAHSDSDRDEHLIWAKRHPSALKMFEEIMSASAGRQIVLFLDYDGTLTPIVDDPDRAFMSDAMRDAVREVARCFPTAIVSGRCRNKVYNFVRLAELYYAGSHGMDIKVPAKGTNFKKSNGKSIIFQPATKFLPMVDKVYKTLLETTKCIPGSKIENNKFCVSVHFRCVDEKQWSGLADQVKLVLREYPKLRLTPGRKVLEIRPTIKWDKGMAMEFLLESLGFSNSNDVLPIYIGDDCTDEDAFKALRNRGSQGVGILVSKFPKETSASYSLQDPSEVMDFLQWLVDWKRLSFKPCTKV